MAPSNAPFPEVNATLFQNKILPTLRHHNGAQSHVKFSRVGEISTFDGIESLEVPNGDEVAQVEDRNRNNWICRAGERSCRSRCVS